MIEALLGLSEYRWWRRWRGGVWYHVYSRLDVYCGYYWTQTPPRYSNLQTIVGKEDHRGLYKPVRQ